MLHLLFHLHPLRRGPDMRSYLHRASVLDAEAAIISLFHGRR